MPALFPMLLLKRCVFILLSIDSHGAHSNYSTVRLLVRSYGCLSVFVCFALLWPITLVQNGWRGNSNNKNSKNTATTEKCTPNSTTKPTTTGFFHKWKRDKASWFCLFVWWCLCVVNLFDSLSLATISRFWRLAHTVCWEIDLRSWKAFRRRPCVSIWRTLNWIARWNTWAISQWFLQNSLCFELKTSFSTHDYCIVCACISSIHNTPTHASCHLSDFPHFSRRSIFLPRAAARRRC